MHKIDIDKNTLDEIYALRQNHTLKELGLIYNINPVTLRAKLRINKYPLIRQRRTDIPQSVSAIELSYIAGLIDGEGNIDIKRRKVVMSNTNFELLFWLKNTVGGVIINQPKYKENHSNAWQWRVNACLARDLLRKVLPYLIIKKDIACRFIESA